MEKIDVYKIAAGVAVVAILSWIFSMETLFVLGLVITIAFASMYGVLVSVMVVSERISTEFAREKGQWKNMEAGARVSHQ